MMQSLYNFVTNPAVPIYAAICVLAVALEWWLT